MSLHEELRLDIETLGTDVDSIVTQIGVVQFSLSPSVTDFIGKSFIYYPDIQEQARAGRTIAPSTVAWHIDQVIKRGDKVNTVILGEDAQVRSEYISYQLSQFVKGAERVWCKDFPILSSYFDSLNVPNPLSEDSAYRKQLDMRTVVSYAQFVLGVTVPKQEVLHSTLDDCYTQIEELRAIHKKVLAITHDE